MVAEKSKTKRRWCPSRDPPDENILNNTRDAGKDEKRHEKLVSSYLQIREEQILAKKNWDIFKELQR